MPLPENSQIVRLTPDYTFKRFNCGDSDLNEFLLEDSISYLRKLLAVTNIIENNDQIIAFFSLLNDKITIDDTPSKNQWKKLFKKTTGKSFKSHPAMKIGRLGVDVNYQSSGIGTIILDYLKNLFIDNNRTGCRFITVDAYRESLAFYQRNDFQFMTSEDENADTRLMYFDLYTLSDDN
ncbi:GNAT family N-acetyltransferase [Marivirga tractuosa]|uniref:GNAT family N-acetyltransferase n=1 Tax=Marivirga tractuosa TaxID=1006 RepID=UPI0035CEDEFB